MIVLICGGRDYSDSEAFDLAMEQVPFEITMVIQGGANGADLLSKIWATNKGIHSAEVNALWTSYNKAAGYKRNAAMLQLNPDYCFAFPGGKGTDMMVSLCEKADIKVWQPYKEE